MKELRDYSRDFDPNLNLQDFSKDAIIELLMQTSKLYMQVCGFYDNELKKTVGFDEADRIGYDAWLRHIPYSVKWVAQAFNIQGNDVDAVFRALQFHPGWGLVYKCDYELKNKNHGIMTVIHCPTLEYFEKTGQFENWGKRICEVWDPAQFQEFARLFNPAIKVNTSKLPPRKSKDDVPCIWEFKLES